MSNRHILVHSAAVAALCFAAACAQASPSVKQTDGRDMRMAQWHEQMCSDMYARRAGEMAYLEAKLSLSDSQRPLFQSWKDVVLSDAKTRSGECTARKDDHMRPMSMLDREARMHDMLQRRLAEMDAQRPTLTALYQSLTPDQKHVLDMPRGPRGHGGPGGHGGWHDHGPGDHGGPGGPGPDGAPGQDD